VKVKTSAGRMRKGKVVSSSESDYDVAEDVPNITPSTSRKSISKKIVQTVDNVPINKVSFHLPANALRWKFIFHRRLALERELGKEAVKMTDVMDMIKKAGLLKTVCNFGNCYEKLVNEFLVNIFEECDNSLSQEYQKVYVRGECVHFSPNIINKFLGINEPCATEPKVTENQVSKEITANHVKVWPKKGRISSGKLSVKYAILDQIAAINWIPTTHSSDVATGLGKFIYLIGTKTKMNIGKYVFEQTVKHAKNDVVKCPIAFPTLLCGITLDQHPSLITTADILGNRESPLTLHPKLFSVNHVPDIVGTSGNVPATGLMTKQKIMTDLKDTCVMLDERKARFERMIHALEKEDAAAENELEESNEENADDAKDDNVDEVANGNEDASGKEDSGSIFKEVE